MMQSSPQKDAHYIIERLTVDFANEDKFSCRDCLRSKAMPCSQVQSLLEEQQGTTTPATETMKNVVLTDAIVLAEVQMSLKQRLDDSGSTALFQINKVATSIRFLQLLLSLPRKLPLQEQSNNVSTTTSPTTTTKYTTISIDRLDQLIHTCLNDLVQSVCQLQMAWIQKENTRNEDDTSDEGIDVLLMDTSRTHSDVRPVTAFVFVSILRLHIFGKQRQQWMIPLCKSLCDLAITSNQIQVPLPPSLIEDAIRSMNKLLEEGSIMLTNDAICRWDPSSRMDTTPAEGLELSHHSFFAKFLSFLAARIISLFPLLGSEESSSSVAVFSSSWKVLTLLLGQPRVLKHLYGTQREGGHSIPENNGYLQNHYEMAEKLEKQLLKILWNKKANKENRIPSSLLRALLEIRVKRKRSCSPLEDMVQNGRIWGRALLLCKFLSKTNGDTTVNGLSCDTELLLKLCEVYHTVYLPECFGILASTPFTENSVDGDLGTYDLIMAPLHSMTTFLLRVESSFLNTDASKRAQFHRLILRWLAGFSQQQQQRQQEQQKRDRSANTPQFMGHPMATHFVSALIFRYLVNGPDDTVPALLTLMVKLLFDARTITSFRYKLSRILNRLLTSVHPLSKILGDLIESEFGRVWKEARATTSPMKKRNRDKPKKRSTIQAYSLSDVEAIGCTLSLLQDQKSSFLCDAVKSLLLNKGLIRNGKSMTHTQANSIALLIWYAEGAMFGRSMSSELPSDSDQRILLRSLVERTVAQLSRGGSNYDFQMPFFLCTISIFRAVCNRGSSCLPLRSMCQLLVRFTQGDAFPGNDRLCLESIGILGSMAASISESCPPEILDFVRSIFLKSLSSMEPCVVRLAQGSLVRFGRKLSAKHATLLPTMLPADGVASFQARAQGLVWKSSGSCEIRTDLKHLNDLGTRLESCVLPRSIEKSIFPTLNSHHLICGSFYLQMPTQDGRQAIVIFPPGEQSLEDIRYMYEIQDGGDLPNVQVLQRVVLNTDSDGDQQGCKLILQPLEKKLL